ncbi:NADH-ubiquinone oxidoreductase chain 6 [Sesamum angolense]|uniref:NADH-ubiquinone oxidoreductase chain 6 n=1 Tax=Sesamum angolense TaxID=2727404 RepID=A0AAE1T5F4_9LAMI|nr:NADH-ubiquinone oxidoreductase chain 6 [Sesamum angolense]
MDQSKTWNANRIDSCQPAYITSTIPNGSYRLKGRTTYYDTFCFVEPCFGLWFDGCLDFFAMIFPVVHIGAIAVSFLFVVMMFNIQIAEIHEEVLRYLPVSGIIGLIFWWEMFFILDNESIPLLPTQRNTTSLRYTVYAESQALTVTGRVIEQAIEGRCPGRSLSRTRLRRQERIESRARRPELLDQGQRNYFKQGCYDLRLETD